MPASPSFIQPPSLTAAPAPMPPAPPEWQALLVGGPLHGTVMPLARPLAVTLMPEREGEQYLYVRRNLGHPGAETALFVYGGKPTPDQVQDAVNRAPLTQTAKMRVLGPEPL